jgi:RNA polymerase sigma factor (sigma-70 family)
LAIEAHEAFRVGRRLRRALTLDAGVTQIASDGAPNDELLSLREAVHRLPERIRAAVVLHYMAGLTVEETAGAMGVSQNTVKTQLRIGLDKLREVLDAAS